MDKDTDVPFPWQTKIKLFCLICGGFWAQDCRKPDTERQPLIKVLKEPCWALCRVSALRLGQLIAISTHKGVCGQRRESCIISLRAPTSTCTLLEIEAGWSSLGVPANLLQLFLSLSLSRFLLFCLQANLYPLSAETKTSLTKQNNFSLILLSYCFSCFLSVLYIHAEYSKRPILFIF